MAGGPGGGGGGGNGLFGGATGPFRLLNEAMGAQAGWFLGFALVAGIAVLAATKLRRSDPRTGWLLAVGGAFLTTVVAFSYAQGIFHPYYVSLLAPFTAALVGAGFAQLSRDGSRILAALAVLAGVLVEVKVLHDNPTSLAWLPNLLVAAGIAAIVALALLPRRAIALGAVIVALLIAPAVWSAQTLGHATNGTFPAGGPQTARIGGPGRGGGPGNGGFGGRAIGAPGRATAGGGPFGGDSASLTAALAYARAHGGGTVAVSSQNGAGQQVIDGANVAAIGGFSGNESQVTAKWLADAVRAGRIRYVLTSGAAGCCSRGI